jgi:hypothetical protein
MGDRTLWRRWVLWTTAGEVAGFTAPAVAGVLTADVDGMRPLVALVLAGLVEGAALGAAQAHVLRSALPALEARAFTVATAAGAAFAYLVGMTPPTLHDDLADLPGPVLAAGAAVGGTLLLGSIGTTQWWVLRRVLPRSGSWVLTTAAAWLVGLAVFLLVATPLWHEGQSTLGAVGVGVGAAVLMAATVAMLTGAALVRLLRRTG